jgi:hypothetical protein
VQPNWERLCKGCRPVEQPSDLTLRHRPGQPMWRAGTVHNKPSIIAVPQRVNFVIVETRLGCTESRFIQNGY